VIDSRSKLAARWWRLALSFLLLSLNLHALDWPTFGHDAQRSGWAPEETALTPQSAAQLELKWKVQMKNAPRSLTALTAPVVASNVDTAKGRRTVVYVAGSSDHVFALDAASGDLLWSHTFETHALPKDETMWLCPNNLNATPVIDKHTATLYAIASDGKLWGLDLARGTVKFGPAQFVPPYSKNWSLNLRGSTVYTSISQGCGGAYSGIYAMDVAQPRHPVVESLMISSKTGPAGIWGRGGPVIGPNGRVYAATGDGALDPDAGDFGSSFIAASLRDLRLLDYYSPVNSKHLTDYDLDISAASPVWLASGDYNLLAGGGKEGVLYLLDADSLGAKDHHTALAALKLANDEEAFQGQGIWGAPATWQDDRGQSWLYVPIYGPVSTHAPRFPLANGPTPHGCLMAFRVRLPMDTALPSGSRKPTLEPVWVSGDLDLPDPPAIAEGVVFVQSTGENPTQTVGPRVIYSGQKLLTDQQREQDTHHSVLYALDAKTGKVLYQSGQTMTSWVHFSGLAIAEGRVFAVDHDSNVYCFGLREK
jgi:outer membrane protein assembly factor BamB